MAKGICQIQHKKRTDVEKISYKDGKTLHKLVNNAGHVKKKKKNNRKLKK